MTTSLSAVTIAMRSCGEQRTLRSGLIGAEETLEEKSGSWGDVGSNGFDIVLLSCVERMYCMQVGWM
jgi:hypothetical protein